MRNRVYIVNKYNEGDKAHCLYIVKTSFIIYSNISIPRKGNILMLHYYVYNLKTFLRIKWRRREKEREGM